MPTRYFHRPQKRTSSGSLARARSTRIGPSLDRSNQLTLDSRRLLTYSDQREKNDTRLLTALGGISGQLTVIRGGHATQRHLKIFRHVRELLRVVNQLVKGRFLNHRG